MQGRFKRDGSAAAEPERGGSDRGSSAQHAQNPASVQSGDSGPGAARTGAPGGIWLFRTAESLAMCTRAVRTFIPSRVAISVSVR
ncbi:hypothetical protein, partial [Streptomyces spectabilis]|uniref:hypothetical protein n=1 Tax=Streptomyces spectabilis TaxID=68270 RepID=UPI003F4D4809